MSDPLYRAPREEEKRARRYAAGPFYRLAPAVGEPVAHALGGDAGFWMLGDESHARVMVSVHLLARLGVVDDRVNAVLGHEERVLLRGVGNLAVADAAHASAPAIN